MVVVVEVVVTRDKQTNKTMVNNVGNCVRLIRDHQTSMMDSFVAVCGSCATNSQSLG